MTAGPVLSSGPCAPTSAGQRLAPEFPDVTFVEVDHPATQAVKRKAQEGIGPRPPNLHLLGVDLSRSPLEAAHRRTGPGSRLLFTYILDDSAGKPTASRGMRWMIDQSLRLAGKPLLWSVHEGAFHSFLERHGFRLDESPERVDLHRRYLVPVGLSERMVRGLEYPAVVEKR
jgi:O-methyltransferase involved in polyketide biosynthesis